MNAIFSIWQNFIPEFIKNIIVSSIIKIKFKAYRNLRGKCDVSIKDLINSNIIIGENGRLGENIYLSGKIKINNNIFISSNVSFYSDYTYGIKIGSFCSIGPNSSFYTKNHDTNKLTTYDNCFLLKNTKFDNIGGKIEIGNDVWIGANVIILPNVKIGNGVVIGAGTIVTKDIPKYAIAVGNPAKVIKYRFNNEIIEKIEKSQWWNWDIEKIEKNYNLEFIK